MVAFCKLGWILNSTWVFAPAGPQTNSARWTRIWSWRVYEGFNASGGLRAFAENLVTESWNRSFERPFRCLIDLLKI